MLLLLECLETMEEEIWPAARATIKGHLYTECHVGTHVKSHVGTHVGTDVCAGIPLAARAYHSYEVKPYSPRGSCRMDYRRRRYSTVSKRRNPVRPYIVDR